MKMKFIYNLLAISTLLVSFTGCKSDDDPGAKEEFIKNIGHTWSINSISGTSAAVFLDGQDVTGVFSDFEMTVNSDLSYVTNSNVIAIETFPWPQSGFFTVNDDLTQLTRDDGVVIDVTASDALLTLEFIYSSEFDNNGGRTQAVLGTWKFELAKK